MSVRAFLAGCWAGTVPVIPGFGVNLVAIAVMLAFEPQWRGTPVEDAGSLLLFSVIYEGLIYQSCFDRMVQSPATFRAFAIGILTINVLSLIPVIWICGMLGEPIARTVFQKIYMVTLMPILVAVVFAAQKNGRKTQQALARYDGVSVID